jgi:alpha-tubulin suppressor-like RCC1 family protein
VCNSTGGLVNCSGVCVSESNDPNNCGACGHKCSTGQVCANGVCSTAFATSKIAVGATFACAVVNGGQVYCWGATSTYSTYPVYLGDGLTSGSTTPVQVTGITTAVSVFAAAFNACALLSDGTVKCWGDNVSGQLGNGTTTNAVSPVPVTGLTNAIAVAGNTYPGGPSFSCAVQSTGGVECWGDNSQGELGNGTTTNSLTPVAVSGLNNAIAIATGADFACALQQGGTVVCWGDAAGGALGNGVTTGYSTTPVTVSGITNAVGVAADYESACAVLATGQVKCWGYNGNDALGDNSTASSTVPVTVYQLNDGTAIVACDGSSVSSVCAATTAGTAYCWGDNTSGQLGNRTTTSSDVPVQVTGLSGVVQVSVGGGAGTGQASACALLSDGSIKCWGSNAYGQLGNGTNTNSLSPVTVIDL